MSARGRGGPPRSSRVSGAGQQPSYSRDRRNDVHRTQHAPFRRRHERSHATGHDCNAPGGQTVEGSRGAPSSTRVLRPVADGLEGLEHSVSRYTPQPRVCPRSTHSTAGAARRGSRRVIRMGAIRCRDARSTPTGFSAAWSSRNGAAFGRSRLVRDTRHLVKSSVSAMCVVEVCIASWFAHPLGWESATNTIQSTPSG